MNKELKYQHYLAYFLVFFFVNNLFLPQGLLYTTLLTPVFIYWLYKTGKMSVMLSWGLLLLAPVPFHFLSGADPGAYIVSALLVAAAWVFLFTALEAVTKIGNDPGELFRKVLLANSLLVTAALLILPFEPVRGILWDSTPMSASLPQIPRLKLLAYEPSHYALLLSPVFLWFLLKVITGRSAHPLLTLAAIGTPLLLSLSFGVGGALLIATVTGMAIYYGKLPVRSRRSFIYGLSGLAVLLAMTWLLWPGNPVFVRTGNIFEGTDTSAKGRLFHSFMFSWDLIRQHQGWMGVGPGQVKILAHDLIINYYQYTGKFAEVVRIPNSMAEMLAVYGLYGLLLKLFFSVFFFFRLKIYRNLFSLVLFLFIFIYQFTGSFIINAAEIGIWALVFRGRFTTFDLDRLKQQSA